MNYIGVFVGKVFSLFFHILEINKNAEFFSKICEKLSSQNKNYFFCEPEHYGLNHPKKPHFSRLFSGFQKWTFINVQNPFPFWTFVFSL
jgi:hypothetical protein